MIKWDIPKRYLRLSLYRPNVDGKPDVLLSRLTEDADVEFNTSAAVTGALNEANLVIGGLRKDTMFFLATSSTPWIKNWTQVQLVIDAGYDNRHSQVFSGVVMDADVEMNSANGRVTLKALSQFPKKTEVKSQAFENDVSVNTIASNLASDLGLPLVSDIGADVTINNFALRETSAIAGLRNLSEQTGLDVYIDNGRVYVKEQGKALQNLPTQKITTNDIIGTPKPTPLGVDIDVRMAAQYISGQKIEVDSLKFPQLKSYDFHLRALYHGGHTRGNAWYTRLQLTKEGMGWYA